MVDNSNSSNAEDSHQQVALTQVDEIVQGLREAQVGNFVPESILDILNEPVQPPGP
jgi:predicted transcriptional regulator